MKAKKMRKKFPVLILTFKIIKYHITSFGPFHGVKGILKE